MASCALRVWVSSSASASSSRCARSRPAASDASSTSSQDSWSTHGRPIPGFCEPWPGNVKAIVMLARLRGVAAPMYDQRSSAEVSVVSRLREEARGQPDEAASLSAILRRRKTSNAAMSAPRTKARRKPARPPRTFRVTRHRPRLRSSLRPGIPTGRGSGLKTRTVRVRIPPGARSGHAGRLS